MRAFKRKCTLQFLGLSWFFIAVFLLQPSTAVAIETLVIHNNTGATITVTASDRYGGRTVKEVPPETIERLTVRPGFHDIAVEAFKVRPLPRPYGKTIFFNHGQTHALTIFASHFGRRVILDIPEATECTCGDRNNDGSYGVYRGSTVLRYDVGNLEQCKRVAAFMEECRTGATAGQTNNNNPPNKCTCGDRNNDGSYGVYRGSTVLRYDVGNLEQCKGVAALMKECR